MAVGFQQPQLLQLCAETQDQMNGEGCLIMDMPDRQDTEMVAMVQPSADEEVLSQILPQIPAQIGVVHGPQEPQALSGARRKSCAFDCYCDCHTDATEDHSIKQKLHFSISKTSRRPCSVTTCQHSTALPPKKLILPPTNFRKALITFMMSKGWKLKHHLNTYRMVPETSESMRYAKHGDLINLKACIESGIATPFDTAPDGWSLLHVCYLTLEENWSC